MTLLDKATSLQLRLEAASEADAGDELLARCRTVRDELLATVDYLDRVQAYRQAIGRDSRVLDGKEIRQAAGRFKGALSKNGPRACQQQTAATLLEVAKKHTGRAERWARSTWKDHFEEAGPLLERAESGNLHGSSATTARSRAAQIRVVAGLNPVSDREALEERLREDGPVACIGRVKTLIGELRTAIDASDAEHAALTPEVQDILRRAAGQGIPLDEITQELLTALRTAGVISNLVVRRD